MTEQGNRQALERLLGMVEEQREYEVRAADDFVREFPQSGERIRGRDNMKAVFTSYPGGPPSTTVRRIIGSGDLWSVELTNDYGTGEIYHVVGIFEFRDGKIVRETT